MSSIEVPKILIATGRTGSGKTTLVGNLIAKSGFKMVNGLTTRAPRSSDLPGEFTYLSDAEFDATPAADMMFSTKHGSPSRYTFLRSAVHAALNDGVNTYTRPLSPVSAGKVVAEFGEQVIKVLYLPTPDSDELERRVIARGDNPAMFTARAENEAGWDDIAKATPGIHVATGSTIQELHAEALELMRPNS